MQKKIALIATMDTKSEEAFYLRGLLDNLGHSAYLIDVGALSPPSMECDADNRSIAKLAGWDLDKLVAEQPRDQIMAAMGKGAALKINRLMASGGLSGVMGLGGNQGTAMASMAMRGLPLGFPRLLVSTVASGNLRPFVGHHDIYTVFSVSDMVGGPNPVSRVILRNAAAALAGMVEKGGVLKLAGAKPVVAVTELGNTEKGAHRAVNALRKHGCEVVTFHASGAGGSAMEELIRAGAVQAVFDLTPHELAEEVTAEGIYQPVTPGRLTAAGSMGIPQVVACGGLEYLCFGPKESIPPHLRRRKIKMHNPLNANLKLSRAEMAKVGQVMGQRLAASKGPVSVLVPLKGWSVYGSPGGPLYDAAGNRALIRSLKANLPSRIKCQELELHINDPEFVDLCLHELIKLMETVYVPK